MEIATLDVTQIEPRLKHPTIFQHFDALKGGEDFIIFNDHDPKPLYYQLLGERGQTFTWEYLEQGPEHWRVKIGKLKADEPQETVGELAARDLRKAAKLRALGIDFCCGGKKTVKEAIGEIGLTEEAFNKAMEEEINNPAAQNLNFSDWDIGFLADYISNVHHQYIRKNGPLIIELAQKVAGRHGAQHPELPPLARGLEQLITDLNSHIAKEDRILFPAIKALATYLTDKSDANRPQAGLTRVIQVMEEEHQQSGDELRTLRKLTGDYVLPPDACNSYTYLFDKIKEFEQDLFMHIHLENNILFPNTLKAEASL